MTDKLYEVNLSVWDFISRNLNKTKKKYIKIKLYVKITLPQREKEKRKEKKWLKFDSKHGNTKF